MSWKEQKPQQSGRRQSQASGPPDLVELLKKAWGASGRGRGPRSFSSGSGSAGMGRLPIWIVLVLLFFWFVSGIFILKPTEEAVVLRFGKYSRTLGPGPHWIPSLIDRRFVMNVQQVNTFSLQADMLTKDENIVSVALAVQFRIRNLRNFFFNVVGPVRTLKEVTSSALRQVVGSNTLDNILTTGRQQVRDQVYQQLRQTLNAYHAGIAVTDVNLQPAKPPEAVTAAFDDAIKAREDEQRYINQAQAYARKVISEAKGQVARLKQHADAYQKQVVLESEGKTAEFLALLRPYLIAPRVTRERMYISTLTDVLSRTSNIVVDSNGNQVLYLPLDQLIRNQQASDVDAMDSSGVESTEVSATGAEDVIRPAANFPRMTNMRSRANYGGRR